MPHLLIWSHMNMLLTTQKLHLKHTFVTCASTRRRVMWPQGLMLHWSLHHSNRAYLMKTVPWARRSVFCRSLWNVPTADSYQWSMLPQAYSHFGWIIAWLVHASHTSMLCWQCLIRSVASRMIGCSQITDVLCWDQCSLANSTCRKREIIYWLQVMQLPQWNWLQDQ